MKKDSHAEVDLELEDVPSESYDEGAGKPSYQINTFPADFTLEVLYQKWKNGDFEIPAFQRGFVWKQPQASKLIESFLLGLPVPPIFLFTSRDSAKQLVVDGQQRLKTICFFFDGIFGEIQSDKSHHETRAVFSLKGLDEKSPINGKTYAELSEKDQRRLKDCVLRSFIVQQLDPEDDTSVYHIFERLNTGGTFLSNQEVRNCVYRGEFTSLLRTLNDLPAWRKIAGNKKPDSRQKDIELILRFFAIRFGGVYSKPLKDFMSSAMKKLNKASSSDLRVFSQDFEATCGRILDALGVKPFHITSGLNTAVYDSFMVAVSRDTSATQTAIAAALPLALADPEYKKAIRDATTDVDVMRLRISKVSALLEASNVDKDNSIA